MDVYDFERVQAVWQRVLGKRDGQMLRLEVEEMIAGEFAAATGYESLARQNRRYAPLLLSLSREERRHAMRLTALYRSQWENSPKIAAGVARESLPFPAGIRNAYGEELKTAENYRKMAEKWPEQRKLFLSLAADEQRHSRILRRISTDLP